MEYIRKKSPFLTLMWEWMLPVPPAIAPVVWMEQSRMRRFEVSREMPRAGHITHPMRAQAAITCILHL